MFTKHFFNSKERDRLLFVIL